MTTRFRTMRNERGVVLITGLIVLVVLTLIGLAGMQTTSLEEKMTANTSNRNVAFAAAEAALRDVESILRTTPVLPAWNNTNGRYDLTQGLWALPATDANYPWTGTNSVVFNDADDDGVSDVAITGGTGAAGTGLALDAQSSPRYYMEDYGSVKINKAATEDGGPVVESFDISKVEDEKDVVRATARGVAGASGAEVIVQSLYVKE